MLTRREFLKLAALLPASHILKNKHQNPLFHLGNSNIQNVLVIVFDAWSAANISLYGYPRDTTPQINQLANRAIVYHNHYAAAPWTVPGTGSLLTGTYPWTHRAFKSSDVIDRYKNNNLFSYFSPNNYTFGYSHNPFADDYLKDFSNNIDQHLPIDSLYLNINTDPYKNSIFRNDRNVFNIARHQIFLGDDQVTNSLYLSNLVRWYQAEYINQALLPYQELFGRNVPAIQSSLNYFLLEHAINWLNISLPNLPQPFVGYFHLYPPHFPYSPRNDFKDLFSGNWQPVEKPDYLFSRGAASRTKQLVQRKIYDQYVSYCDAEFARLFDTLEKEGILENTWVVLTSDHGELFEREYIGHRGHSLHEPVTHIPLLVFPPGQKTRIDIFDRTSAIDVLPTLLHVTDHHIPSVIEGQILPPFNTEYSGMNREIFVNLPKNSNNHEKLNKGTLALYLDQYKLIYYIGYDEIEVYDPYIELYNVVHDPEELNNLYPAKKSIALELLEILLKRFNQAEEKYK